MVELELVVVLRVESLELLVVLVVLCCDLTREMVVMF
jgi:hypothetical protein